MHFGFRTAVTSLALGLCAAVPTAQPSCKGTHEVINFENLPTALAGTVSNTTTGGLYFQSIAIFSDTPQVSGLVAHSPHNMAQTGTIQQILGGDALVTTNYPGNTTTAFDVNSLYAGCFLSPDTPGANLPQACTITFTGYKGSDNSVANAQFACAYTVEYNPTTNVGNQQLTFSQSFPSTCKGLQFLTIKFTIEPATLLLAQPRLAVGFDDFDLNVYSC